MKEGSYSVEAALIMPGVVLLMITFLLFGFYLRDIILTEAYGRSLIFNESINIDGEKEEEKERLQECLWYSKIKAFNIYEYENRICVHYKLVPITDFVKVYAENRIIIEKEEKTSEKIQNWKVWIDEAEELFFTEE